MKKKINIIKKISQPNKIIKIPYKKELRYILKKKNFRNKKFIVLIKLLYSLKHIYKLSQYFKYNSYKIKKKLLTNSYIYFNYITDGLNLKYDDLLIQKLDNSSIIFSNYLGKKSIVSCIDDLKVVKTQKFIALIDSNYIAYNISCNSTDYFIVANNLIFCYLYEIYKNNIITLLAIIN